MTPAPTVLILAAGQGTRMRSRTPKVLHEICGRPMVLWPVHAALDAGAGKVVVVDSPERALREVLPAEVRLVVQPRPDGTGGAVLAAVSALDQAGSEPGANAGTGGSEPGTTVVVLSGDVPLVSADTIRGLAEAHVQSGAAATVVTTVLSDPSGYGRVVRGADSAVERVVETKQPGDATPAELEIKEVNTGIYAFTIGPLREALPRLSAENAQRELYLPQVLDILISDGHSVAAHTVEDPRLLLGVNDRVALSQVRALAQLAIHHRHMRAGVTIVDPSATTIDVDVQIGHDTVIEPFTTLSGRTQIGAHCTVRHSYLLDCLLEDHVTVGPFAYLRPNATLRTGAKAGTFVEIKNSDIGPFAKIPHLSYIGDADVGERTNLGASTITANYDGVSKHRTSIGAHVHSSVHVSFVAPVSIGDSAYTAAGSVISDDVPPGALAIARSRQTNKPGYSQRRQDESPARPADQASAQGTDDSPGRPSDEISRGERDESLNSERR